VKGRRKGGHEFMAENTTECARVCIDEVKEFWNRRPCNIHHSCAPIGSREYFDEVEARKFLVEPHILQFTQFDKWRGKKVLEIGCGIGTAAVCFARAGADYTGIELSDEALKLTEKRFEVYGVRGNLFLGNAEDLSSVVPIEQYDLIYSFGVIHHSPHPEKIVADAKKYMGPHSEFRLMIYARNSWKNIMIEAGLDQPEAQSGCPIAFTYTESEARELLRDYDIIDLRQDHIFPYVIENYVKYEYQLQPYFEMMPSEIFRALERALGWHMLIRCKLRGT
jgi:SAM-dependent methyltransferase